MIDYISVIKYLDKDNPFMGHCNQLAAYSNGWQQYVLEGCERMKVFWNPETRLLKLQGSLMYFWQGHNFSCSKPDFVQAVEYIQGVLQVGLWDSEITAFEYGAIVEVEHYPKQYIQSHHARAKVHMVENEKGKDEGCFRWWENSTEKIKMYDARKNILLKQGMHRRDVIQEAGWDPEKRYLKFEVHFLKPHMLNNGKAVLLEDLLNPSFYHKLHTILLEQYKLLAPMKTLQIPTTKKNLSCADIVLLAYVEGYINVEGNSPAAALKALNKRVNSIPDEILSKADKDGRKRQIKALFAKVKEAPESQWDISDKLEAALEQEWISG